MLVQYEQANAQPSEQANEQVNEQPSEHIITILNLYFKYIYNKASAKNFKIKEADKKAIVILLKRLGMYAENYEIFDYYKPNDLLDLKLQYWAIKEIYFSPYKVYLNEMTREQFMLRFLKSKKYVKTSDTWHFLNYFIKSIQEELYKDKNRGGNGKEAQSEWCY